MPAIDLSTDPSTVVRSSRRRLLRPLIAAALTALVAAGTVLASTPVVNGYRDQAYGGGTFRPTSDKPQSKLWYVDGSWWAPLFVTKAAPAPKSEYRIHKLDPVNHAWVDTGVVLDTRDRSHADYLWDGSSLWVASNFPITVNGVDDATKIFRYTYNGTTFVPVAGYPVEIPGTKTAPSFVGGSITVTLAREATGRLWAVWPKGGEVRYSNSNDGLTWSAPATVPVQTNSINPHPTTGDIASVIRFGASPGTNIGIMWSDHDGLPTPNDDGYFFAYIGQGDDPTVGANWTLQELPTLVPGANPQEVADDHINLKATSTGEVYMVGKTGKDTLDCATNKQLPLIELFRRNAAGVWSTHLVSTVGDCSTRPQVILNEELDVVYVVMTSPNGGGFIYMKSAPMTGPEALKFRGPADQTTQRGTPFIRSSTETSIDDPTTTKQNVTSASGIVVLANNILNTKKFYLHNNMSQAASDGAPPNGSLSLNDGAAFTTTTQIVASIPATDSGSGVSLVRLSNSAAVSGGLLTTGTTYSYSPAIAWSLAAGADGVRNVYAQFRDGKGNWSVPITDAITLDANAPTGTVAINGGAAATTSRNVNLNLTSNDGGGTGVTSVRISNTTDFSASTPIPYAATVPWTLTAGDGVKTVYVKFVDAAGNISAGFNDSITLNAPPTGTVRVNGGASFTTSTSVNLTFPGTSSDVTHVRVGNAFNLSARPWVAFTAGMTLPHTLTSGNGLKHVYAQFRDATMGLSSVVSDAINLGSGDIVKPTVPGAPVHRVAGAVTTGFPIRLTWTASTDSGSGVANYILQQSVNGGAYTTIANPTGTSIDLQLSSSSRTYRFRVAARDNAGNASAYATGISFRTVSTSESGAAMAYTGSWPLASSSAFIGGKAKYATAAGATATLTFTGNRVAWLSQKGPTSGSARVYIDGKLLATINLYSPTTLNKQVVYQKSWTAVTTRKLRVVVIGTAGHPRVTIDQFFSVR